MKFPNDFAKETYNKTPKELKGNDKRTIFNIMQPLFFLVEYQQYGRDKADVAYKIFNWLSLNQWILKENDRLRDVVKAKLVELKSEPNGKKIIEDFGWIIDKDYNSPEIITTKIDKDYHSPEITSKIIVFKSTKYGDKKQIKITKV